jgi:hypothetical protein
MLHGTGIPPQKIDDCKSSSNDENSIVAHALWNIIILIAIGLGKYVGSYVLGTSIGSSTQRCVKNKVTKQKNRYEGIIDLPF